MIASHTLIQAEAGPTAIVTAAPRQVPGIPGTATAGGPVTARSGRAFPAPGAPAA